MFTLITGGSACGKSEYAESLVMGLPGERIYLATMEPFGSEARERIRRHLLLREGKGFTTIERFTDIGNVPLPAQANVLLEDIGNLLAGEMFREDGSGEDAVLSGMEKLLTRCRHLTVVTNETGLAGKNFSEETLQYMRSLGRINCLLAARADRVAEVLSGIAVIRKELTHDQ